MKMLALTAALGAAMLVGCNQNTKAASPGAIDSTTCCASQKAACSKSASSCSKSKAATCSKSASACCASKKN